MEAFRVIASLVLVFGLLGGLLWGLKRLQGQMRSGQSGRRMQVVESLSLGPRQKLALVRVGDQEVLLGISPGQIAALGQWPAGDPAASASFAQALSQEAGHAP